MGTGMMPRSALLTLCCLLMTSPARAQTGGACPDLPTRSGASDAQRSWHDSLRSTRASAAVVGMVVDLDDQPLAGVRMTLRLPGRTNVLARTYSDSAGRFALSTPRRGLLEISFEHVGFLRQTQTILAFAASADTLCLRMRAIPFAARQHAGARPLQEAPSGTPRQRVNRRM